jgi:hypothetical protein
MSAKLVNIATMPGMGQYRVEDDGRTLGEVYRTNRVSYLDGTGKAWPVSVVVWVAESARGQVVGVARNRVDAVRLLTGWSAQVNGVVQ